MKIKNILFCFSLILVFAVFAVGQNLKRTTTKTERADLGAGGTVTIVGAPEGSIKIEGWQQSVVEVTAEIEISAATEEDLALLAKVNSFAFEEDFNHISILTVGVQDKQFIKQNFKKFPKRLLGLPWRVDYTIKVPNFSDLEINAGRGNFDLSGVEGAININALQSTAANLNLVGGLVQATFGGDKINVSFDSRGWRGRGAEIQVARGELNIIAPPNLNADLDFSILRTGKIENTFENLKPRDKSKFSETSMLARAGVGGAKLSFTVGDGTLRFGAVNRKLQ